MTAKPLNKSHNTMTFEAEVWRQLRKQGIPDVGFVTSCVLPFVSLRRGIFAGMNILSPSGILTCFTLSRSGWGWDWEDAFPVGTFVILALNLLQILWGTKLEILFSFWLQIISFLGVPVLRRAFQMDHQLTFSEAFSKSVSHRWSGSNVAHNSKIALMGSVLLLPPELFIIVNREPTLDILNHAVERPVTTCVICSLVWSTVMKSLLFLPQSV